MVINKLVATGLLAPMALLGLSAAASAQPAAPAGPESAAPTEPQSAAPAGPESAAPAAPADNAAQAAAPAANPQIVAFVDHQYPIADTDGDGTLTAAEFTAWIRGLKAAELEKAGQPDPAAAQTYADTALANADVDKDAVLGKDELVKFFGG